MRKILFFMLTSLNGYYERGRWDIDWHNANNAEFGAFSDEQLRSVDLILFGRVTYEGMASFWPTAQALESEPVTAELMNNTAKIVFSHTLERVDWQNTRLVTTDPADEILRLKAEPGKDIAIFGSSDLAVSLAERGVIDEFRILVNPIALPAGKPLFTGLKADLPLKLLSVRSFESGNVLLTYGPDRPSTIS